MSHVFNYTIYTETIVMGTQNILWKFEPDHSIFPDFTGIGSLKYKEANSRKYQREFEVISRVKTWQIRGIWSQQLEHKRVPQWGKEPGVRKGKRSLLACHTRCKWEWVHVQSAHLESQDTYWSTEWLFGYTIDGKGRTFNYIRKALGKIEK